MADLTILIPLDGSKPAELALSFLRALEPLGKLRAQLLSVVEADESTPSEEVKRREKLVADYLDGVAERAETNYGCRVECIHRTGQPHAEILDEASRQDVNLILMTTHGRTLPAGEHLGSVADKVIRGASCPTLLIGPQASVPLQIRQITVPLDGSQLAAEALPVARVFAERLNSRLRLVQAVQFPSALETDAIGSLAADAIESLELTASLYLAEAKLELETVQPVDTAVLAGRPADALLSDLRENRPDLVIMASHGRTGFIHWALGSVTDRLDPRQRSGSRPAACRQRRE